MLLKYGYSFFWAETCSSQTVDWSCPLNYITDITVKNGPHLQSPDLNLVTFFFAFSSIFLVNQPRPFVLNFQQILTPQLPEALKHVLDK